LTDITQKITEADLAVISLNARTNKEKLVLMNITLEIKNVEQLKELLKKIKIIKGVIDAYRVTT
jgi:guanosine-3',5'-bis(diphosphate) 3'-pyrophosphohydrolase